MPSQPAPTAARVMSILVVNTEPVTQGELVFGGWHRAPSGVAGLPRLAQRGQELTLPCWELPMGQQHQEPERGAYSRWPAPGGTGHLLQQQEVTPFLSDEGVTGSLCSRVLLQSPEAAPRSSVTPWGCQRAPWDPGPRHHPSRGPSCPPAPAPAAAPAPRGTGW